MAERRDTKQQRVIWEALASAGRPLSVEELFALATKQIPTLGLSTVYRALRRWEGDKRISAVAAVAGQPPRYELAEVADRHHHHFHCERCDKVFDLHDCPGGFDEIAPEGFEVRSHHLTLEGICAECAGNS